MCIYPQPFWISPSRSRMPTAIWRKRRASLAQHLAGGEVLRLPWGFRTPWKNPALRLYTSAVWELLSSAQQELLDTNPAEAIAHIPLDTLQLMWNNGAACDDKIDPPPLAAPGKQPHNLQERAKECFAVLQKDAIKELIAETPGLQHVAARNRLWSKLTANEMEEHRKIALCGGVKKWHAEQDRKRRAALALEDEQTVLSLLDAPLPAPSAGEPLITPKKKTRLRVMADISETMLDSIAAECSNVHPKDRKSREAQLQQWTSGMSTEHNNFVVSHNQLRPNPRFTSCVWELDQVGCESPQSGCGLTFAGGHPPKCSQQQDHLQQWCSDNMVS